MDGGAWWAAVHEVAESWTRLSDFTFTFHFPALEKEMAAHSSVLAWRIPGTGEPHGLPSMHHFMRNRWGNSGNSVRLYFLGSKITADGDCSHEIKRCLLLGRKAMTNLLLLLSHFSRVRTEPLVTISSVIQSCPTPCNPMNRSTPGLPVDHQLPEFTQTHVHRVSDAIHAF